MPICQIDDYYEATALYRLLLSYKYAPNPMHREIFASPLIANFHQRLAQTLKDMEAERGYEERSKAWTPIIEVNSAVWQLLIDNTVAMVSSGGWAKFNETEKHDVADAILTPFSYNPTILDQFIEQVNSRFAQLSN